jgi:hypothetical protein
MVMNGIGEPVDVGRTQRTVPLGIRRALVARDRGCRFPGCDRPPALCHAHHVREWQHQGHTEINNCILLCSPTTVGYMLPEGTSPSAEILLNFDLLQFLTLTASPYTIHSGTDLPDAFDSLARAPVTNADGEPELRRPDNGNSDVGDAPTRVGVPARGARMLHSASHSLSSVSSTQFE